MLSQQAVDLLVYLNALQQQSINLHLQIQASFSNIVYHELPTQIAPY